MSSLRLDWCSHAAAKYAVERWHYSQRMPLGPLVKIGAWEDGEFVGVVIFGMGAANAANGESYGLSKRLQMAELVRVALRAHRSPVTRIVAVALKLLRRANPGLRLVVSFADPAHEHHGGIYQAGNWVYTGQGVDVEEYLVDGRWVNRRTVTSGHFGRPRRFADGGRSLPRRPRPGKHRYLYPLDAAMKAQIAPLAKPYPKRPCAQGVDSDTLAHQAREGGARPTCAL